MTKAKSVLRHSEVLTSSRRYLLLRRSCFGFITLFVLLPLGLALLGQGAVMIQSLRYVGWHMNLSLGTPWVLFQVFCGVCGVVSVMRIAFDSCRRHQTLKPQRKLILGLLLGLGWSVYSIMATPLEPRPGISLTMDAMAAVLFATSASMLWTLVRSCRAT